MYRRLIIAGASLLCIGFLTSTAHAQFFMPFPGFHFFDEADLEVAVDGPTSVPPGGEVLFRVSVLNHGPDRAVGGRVKVQFPPNPPSVSLHIAGGSCNLAGSDGIADCELLPIDSGVSFEFTLALGFSSDAQCGSVAAFTAEVDADTRDPIEENNDTVRQVTIICGSDCDGTPCPPADACPADVFTCPDGTKVPRDLENDCEFRECPDGEPHCGNGVVEPQLGEFCEPEVQGREICDDDCRLFCADSDGGENVEEQGRAVGGTGVIQAGEDYCAEDDVLMEFSCSENEIQSTLHECEWGCRRGECRGGFGPVPMPFPFPLSFR